VADPDVEIGADVDVARIMSDIRSEIARKREAGLYPPEVLEEFDAAVSSTGKEDALSTALMTVRQSAGFTTAVTTDSELPVVAPVAASFKKAIRGSVRWYINGILQQVERFAASVVYALRLTSDRVRELETGAGELDASLESVKGGISSLEATVKSIETERDSVRARDRLPIIERAVRGLRERLEASPVEGSGRSREQAGRGTSPEVVDRSDLADHSVDYVDFENCFRGPEEEIRRRQADYVDYFRDLPGAVVDVGCGRGEFLTLLTEASIQCYGVDRHPDMVGRCKEQGLSAVVGDALDHLASIEPGTLGGIFSAQMIEHLDVTDVPRFFELAAQALAPGGRCVVETLNPRSLFVFSAAFYVDLGHLRPLHPYTLQFLAEKAGFVEVQVDYVSPPPDDLRPSKIEATGDARLDGIIESINENFKRLDDVIFGAQDYAIVATR
jgi:SAM-dependent methyltransferase